MDDDVNGITKDSETNTVDHCPKTCTQLIAVTRKQMNEQAAIHSKREVQWYDEKEALLAKAMLLENNLKEKTEELTKYEALVSKCKEIQSMVGSEKQRNVELSHENEKIKEAADENMKKKDDHIEELNKKLKEKEKKYQELLVINNELEKKNHCSESKARDTELKNTKLQEQINKMENERNEETEELTKNNNYDHENKVEEMKTKYGALVESEKQRNIELSNENEKIKEAADENMKKKDDDIEELNKKLKKEEKKYQELVVISDELEKNNHCSESKARDTELKNTKLQEQINKMENERNEETEELTKNNNYDHKNKVEEMKTKYGALVESEKQRNIELSNENEKIKEAADENMKKKDDDIEELNKKLKKEEKKYQELLVIGDELEKNNHCSESKARDTELKNTKLQEQIKKMENERNAKLKVIQNSMAMLKADLEKLKNERAIVDEKNNKLEEEIIALKLDSKKLQSEKKEFKEKYESDNNNHVMGIQQLTKKIEKLTNECDVFKNRCKELAAENERLIDAEQKLRRDLTTEKNELKQSLETLSNENKLIDAEQKWRRDFATEKKELNESLEILRFENKVLQQRIEHLQRKRSEVLESGRKRVENRNDFNKVMARWENNTISNQDRPTDVTGSKDDRQTIAQPSNEQTASHSKREVQWCDEKEALLAKAKLLENSLKERNEELTKSNNDHKNKVEEMKTEYEALVSKCKKIQSMVESAKQRNVGLSHENEKIKKAADKNMKKKDDHIEELNKKLKKEEKKYYELVVINNDKLEEHHYSEAKARDTELKNTKLQEQIKKRENERNENMKDIKNYNAMLKADLERLKNERAIVDEKNDELEEEIIALKLDSKKLQSEKKEFMEKYESDNNNHVMAIQQLTKKIEKLTNECDVFKNRCKELTKENQRLIDAEQKLRRDFATEKKELNESLEILRFENKVLQSQSSGVMKSRRKRVENRRNDFNKVMVRWQNDSISNQDRPTVVTGSKDDRQAIAQPSSPVPNQWYETDRGEKILRKIMQGLTELFPLTELSRDVTSRDIAIEIKTSQNLPLKVMFPADFPDSPVLAMRSGRREMMKLEYTSSFNGSTFANNVVAILYQKYSRE